MTTDIYTALGLLSRTAPNATLHGFEKQVLGAIRARRQRAIADRMTLGLVSVAALMGLGGALAPVEPVQGGAIPPFGAPHALAPSSLLLLGDRR